MRVFGQSKTFVDCIALVDSPRRHQFATNASRYSVPFEFFNAISVENLRHGATVEGMQARYN